MIVLQKRSCTSMIIGKISEAPAVHSALWLRRTHCWRWRPIRPYPSTASRTDPHRRRRASLPRPSLRTRPTMATVHKPARSSSGYAGCTNPTGDALAALERALASQSHQLNRPRGLLSLRAWEDEQGTELPRRRQRQSSSSYRARLDLVIKTEVPPEGTQGGSRWPRRAVERQLARWHDPVLRPTVRGWLGLMPERPALCLTGLPRRTRVVLSHRTHIYQRAGRSGSGSIRHASRHTRYIAV